MSKKILVIGDICEDVWHYGTCDRLNPEAPVPIIKVHKTEQNLGMAGNVCSNIKSLMPDNWICSLFHPKKLSKKIRYVDSTSGQQLLRVDKDIAADEIIFDCINGEWDAIVISDYGKGSIGLELIEKINYNYSDSLLLIDTKIDFTEHYECFSNFIVKINLKEYHNLKGSNTYVKKLVVTQGEKGCYIIGGNVIPTEPVDVINLSGCGDTFLAALCVNMLETNDLVKACKWANKAAGLAAMTKGIATVKREQVYNGN